MFGHGTTSWDNLIYDQVLRLNSRTPSDRILIVAIDDPSLSALGAWPWPRSLHARLLNRLTSVGVAGVAYDVFFVEPDPAGGDAAFSQALKASGRTVLPILALSPGEDGRAVKIVQPLQPLASVAAALAHVNLVTDADGVARRYSKIEGWQGTCWPHLMTSLLTVAHQAVHSGDDCAPLRVASHHGDALLASQPQLIPFAGPPGRFRTLSAVDVINGEAPVELLKGRLILVGATAAGLGDRHMTAGSSEKGAMPGVEIQANILDASLQGVRLVSLPAWIVALASLAPVSAFMASLLLVRPSANMLVGLCLLAAVFVVSAALFPFGVWLPPVPAAAGLLLAYPLWSWRRLAAASDYLHEEISKFAPPTYASRPALPDDTLGRQVSALSRATDHLRDIMRLFEDALQSLPDATILGSGLTTATR